MAAAFDIAPRVCVSIKSIVHSQSLQSKSQHSSPHRSQQVIRIIEAIKPIGVCCIAICIAITEASKHWCALSYRSNYFCPSVLPSQGVRATRASAPAYPAPELCTRCCGVYRMALLELRASKPIIICTNTLISLLQFEPEVPASGAIATGQSSLVFNRHTNIFSASQPRHGRHGTPTGLITAAMQPSAVAFHSSTGPAN